MATKQRTGVKTAGPQKAGLSVDLDQFKAEIEKRAREIFLKRQKSLAPGDALSDWLVAEKEIKSKHLIS
jgi:hypothetical protein